MKKLLATLLVLTMLLTMFAVPTMAEDTTPPESAKTHVMTIPTSAEINKTEERNGQTYDVVTYNNAEFLVVRTVAQFLAMDDKSAKANFILANDLDFTGVDLTPKGTNASGQVAVVGGADEGSNVYKLHNFYLEGNGYALNNMTLNFSTKGAGLFPSANWRTNTIRHLTINATCNFTADQTGILFGGTSGRSVDDSKIVIDYVTINANLSSTGGKSGAFIGYLKNNAYLTGCKVTGNYKFTGSQVAPFVGMSEDTNTAENSDKTNAPQTLSFTDCTADVNIACGGDSNGAYVGMMFSADGALNFTNCTSAGTIAASVGWDNRSWPSAFASVVGGGKAHTVTFTSCDTTMTIMGTRAAGAYVASTKSDSAVTFNFVNCDNHATVLAGKAGSAWVAEPFTKSTFNFDGTDGHATIIAATNVDYSNNLNDPSETVYTYDAASGELAYQLVEAQKVAGVASDYYFGQTLETDANPAIGKATVYKVESTYAGTFYSNTYTGVETVAADGDNAKAYIQTAAAGEGLNNARVIVAMKEAGIADIAAMEIVVTFTLTDGTNKTLTLDKNDVDCFYSVYAGDKVAEAADGFVLLAITIKNIPTTDWTEANEVKVTMSATDADGNAVPGYSL